MHEVYRGDSPRYRAADGSACPHRERTAGALRHGLSRLALLSASACERAIFGGTLGIALLAPWMYGSDHAGALLILGWGVALLLVLGILEIALVGEGRWAWSSGHTLLLLFFGLALLHLMPLPVAVERIRMPEGEVLLWNRITRDTAATVAVAAKLMLLLAYFLLATRSLRTPRRIHIFALALFGNGIGLALLGLLNASFSREPLLWSFAPGAPAFGPYANRAHFALLMEMVLPIGLAWFLLGGWRAKLWGWTLVLGGGAVGKAASRAGIALLLLQLVAVPLLIWGPGLRALLRRPPFAGERSRAVLVRIGLVGALVLGGGMWIGGPMMRERLASRFREDALSIRGEIWGATLRMIADHPVFGVGLGAFATMYPRYDPSNGLRRTAEAHNDYLQLVAETGVVGGLLGGAFLLFVMGVVRRAFSWAGTSSRAEAATALGASVGILTSLIHSAVDFGLQITANALTFLGLLAVLLRLCRTR